MSSPIAHLACAYAIHRVSLRRRRATGLPPAVNLAAAAFFSLAPDLDFAAAWIARDIESFHNQTSHSFLFALGAGLLGTAAMRVLFRNLRAGAFAMFAWGCVASHLAVDYFTRGRGLMLFWPFQARRYISPWPIFQGVRWDEGWVSASHPITLAQDAIFAAILLGLVWWVFRSRPRAGADDQVAGDAGGNSCR